MGTEGDLHVSDGVLDVFVGIGTQYPFAGIFDDRIWNGRVRYTCQ